MKLSKDFNDNLKRSIALLEKHPKVRKVTKRRHKVRIYFLDKRECHIDPKDICEYNRFRRTHALNHVTIFPISLGGVLGGTSHFSCGHICVSNNSQQIAIEKMISEGHYYAVFDLLFTFFFDRPYQRRGRELQKIPF